MDTRRYVKHFMILMSGTALGQLLNLATYPFLTRTYTPQDFGIFSIFVAIASTLGAIACGRFDVAVQVASHAEKLIVHALSQLINAAFSLLTLIGLTGYWLLFGGQLGPALTGLLAICVFLLGYGSASSLLLLKGERYKLNSASGIARTLLTSLPQLGLFLVWPNALGLSAGFCVGLAAQAVLLKVATRASWRPRVSKVRLCYVFQRYRGYLLDVPNQLLAATSLHALNFLLLAFFTAEDVGFYSVAYRLAALPLGIFATSLSQVFFQKAAQSYRSTGTFWKELRFNLLTSSALAVAIFAGLVLVARPLATAYLGAGWRPAGELMVYLAPMLALRFISVSIATTPLVIGKIHWLLANNLALLAAVLAPALFAWARDLQLTDYLLINVVLGSTAHLVFIIFLIIHTRRHYANPSAQPAQVSVNT